MANTSVNPSFTHRTSSAMLYIISQVSIRYTIYMYMDNDDQIYGLG